MTAVARTIAVALVLATGGCSYIFVRGAGDPAPGERPRCTSAPVAPAIDVAFVALFVFTAYTAHQKMSDADSEDDDLNSEFLRFQRDWSIVSGVFEAGAATYGFVRTTRCRGAKADFDAARPGPPPRSML